MKDRKSFLNMDERNRSIAMHIITIMYFLTILALQAVIIYRQFMLGQSIEDFEDFAVILTVNSLFLITALLYFGAIPIRRIRIRFILAGYAAIVILGSLFTYAKYNIFQHAGLSMGQIFDKIIIVVCVSGLIVLFFVIFSILGKRKQDKELDEG